MAWEQNLHPITVPANADLSASQFLFVDVNSSGQLVTVSSSGAIAVGVLQDKPNAAGSPGEVGVLGMVSKVVAGAAFNNGAEVMSNASGQAITATTGGKYVMGRALAAASGSGVIVPVLLIGPYYKA